METYKQVSRSRTEICQTPGKPFLETQVTEPSFNFKFLQDPKCYLSQSLPEIIRIHLEYTSLLAILEGEVIVFGGIKGVTVSVAC